MLLNIKGVSEINKGSKSPIYKTREPNVIIKNQENQNHEFKKLGGPKLQFNFFFFPH